MTTADWLTLALLALNLVLLLWLASRRPADAPDLSPRIDELARQQREAGERLERELRGEVQASASATRGELGQGLSLFQQALLGQSGDVARTQNEQIDSFRVQLATLQQQLTQALQASAQALAQAQLQGREAMDQALKRFSDSQREQLQALSDANERRLAEVRQTVETKLATLQDGNEKKLEQMRLTVDEKLHATLEQRLGESFKQVADRLDAVHNGLGEMRKLASDVGTLSRTLTNVKTRGTFGEIQLSALLDEVFTAEQIGRNIETVPGSNARVDFAIRLPGRREDGAPLWLPIDAKFPREDYERLLDAQERADPVGVEAAAKAMEQQLRLEAKKIREKYIAPPHTADFGILFVPTEGLYAEALRRPGLAEALQREHKIMLAGPTTLLATLNSLQMGFRTLALEKRSAEVWEVLGAVKGEFAKFGDVLAKTKKKIEEAGNQIDLAETRTRMMARKLKTVETLPEGRAQALLGSPAPDDEAGGEAEV